MSVEIIGREFISYKITSDFVETKEKDRCMTGVKKERYHTGEKGPNFQNDTHD